MGTRRSIILLSGGLDSAANLALCCKRDVPVLALTAKYGQRAADQEVRAARLLCRHYDVRHEVVELDWLGAMGGSALTEAAKSVPDLEQSDLDEVKITRETAKTVWVPNRNGVLINLAAAFAERFRAEVVVVGFNREEATTFPDNSADFIARCNQALELSTATQVKVHCYTTELDKREIVSLLREEDPKFPFDAIWSCYRSGARPCGKCESCQRFQRAVS